MANKSITKLFAALSITAKRAALTECKAIYDAEVAFLTDPFNAPSAASEKPKGKPGRKPGRKPANGPKAVKAPKVAGAPRGRKPSGNALGDKIAKVLSGASAEGMDVEAITAGVKAEGFETKSDDKGLSNQIRGQVSKLKKAGVVAVAERGKYVLVAASGATSDAPAETPAD